MGSQQRFLNKISSFVHSIDEAKLLHIKMFSPEKEEEYIESLQESVNYTRRCKNMYENTFKMPTDKLHLHIRAAWNGRLGQAMSESMKLFHAQYVQPSIDCEPGHSVKEVQLEKLLQFMAGDPNSSSHELELVRSIVTGRLSQHPALQGVLIACMRKLKGLEGGASSMRNRHRTLLEFSVRKPSLVTSFLPSLEVHILISADFGIHIQHCVDYDCSKCCLKVAEWYMKGSFFVGGHP